MADLLSPGSAGLGQFRVDPATGAVRFAPGSAEGWPEGATTETRLTAAVRDAAGLWGFAAVAVDVTREASEDADAAAYLDAVEIADGAALEAGVRAAVDALVKGMKADGIWSAVATMALLSGPRTLAGCVVPLRGPTLTSVNFVSSDLSRTLGLNGNGSSKHLDHNYSASLLGQNDISMGAHATGSIQNTVGRYIDAGIAYMSVLGNAATNGARARVTSGTLDTLGSGATIPGLVGVSRANSSAYSWRAFGGSGSISRTSEAGTRWGVVSFVARNSADGTIFGSSYLPSGTRLTAVWAGAALDLAAMETRLAAYHTAIGAALA